MKKIVSFLLWSVCFVVLLAIGDQFLLRYPGKSVPVLHEFQQFYRSFRSRLLDTELPSPVEQASPGRQVQNVSVPPVATPQAPQYVYVDQDGQLNFAVSLDEIPRAFRDGAQPLNNQ
mgnify:CR=1 FL=1